MKLPRVWLAIIILVVGAASSLFHVWAFDLMRPSGYSDLLPRVIGTRDALRGMNPYSGAVLRDIQTAYYGHVLSGKHHLDPQYFSYPALIIPLLAPFVHFPWPVIEAGFLLLVIPAFIVGCLLWLRLMEPRPTVFACMVVLGLCLCSWPAVWGFRLQQPTMVIFVLLAGAVFSLRRKWDLIAGFCMTFAVIKPQLSLPLLLWLLVWSVKYRRWQFPAGFVVSFTALWLITDSIVPGWFGKWIASLGSYVAIDVPVCEMTFGKPAGLAMTLLLGAWSIWLLWGMLGFDSDSAGFYRAVALGIAASVLITPMNPAFVDDQVLLFPAILLIIFSPALGAPSVLSRMLTLAFLGWNYVALVIAAMIEVFHPESMFGYFLPFADQILPVVVLVSLLVVGEENGWSRCGFGRVLVRGN